jgi:hypothetical protein
LQVQTQHEKKKKRKEKKKAVREQSIPGAVL